MLSPTDYLLEALTPQFQTYHHLKHNELEKEKRETQLAYMTKYEYLLDPREITRYGLIEKYKDITLDQLDPLERERVVLENTALAFKNSQIQPYQPTLYNNVEEATTLLEKLVNKHPEIGPLRLSEIIKDINKEIEEYNNLNLYIASDTLPLVSYKPKTIRIKLSMDDIEQYYWDHGMPKNLEGLSDIGQFQFRYDYPYAWVDYYFPDEWLKHIFRESFIVNYMLKSAFEKKLQLINDFIYNEWQGSEDRDRDYWMYMKILISTPGLPRNTILFDRDDSEYDYKIGERIRRLGFGKRTYFHNSIIKNKSYKVLHVYNYPAGHKVATDFGLFRSKYSQTMFFTYPGEVFQVIDVRELDNKKVVIYKFIKMTAHMNPNGEMIIPRPTTVESYPIYKDPIINYYTTISYYDKITTLAELLNEHLVELTEDTLVSYYGQILSLGELRSNITELNKPYRSEKIDSKKVYNNATSIIIDDNTSVIHHGDKMTLARLLLRSYGEGRITRYHLVKPLTLGDNTIVYFNDFLLPFKDVAKCHWLL